MNLYRGRGQLQARRDVLIVFSGKNESQDFAFTGG